MDSKYLLLSGTQHVIEAKVYWITGFNIGQFLECYDFATKNKEQKRDTAKISVMDEVKYCFGIIRITSLRLQH